MAQYFILMNIFFRCGKNKRYKNLLNYRNDNKNNHFFSNTKTTIGIFRGQRHNRAGYLSINFIVQSSNDSIDNI